MNLKAALVAVSLVTGLAVLPTAGADFTNPTSNDANSFESRQPIRVTTYQLDDTVFTDTTYNVTLAQDLEADYFVVIRGGAGDGTGSGNRSPDVNYARVTQDPHGNFSGSSSSNVIQLGRDCTSPCADAWQGQVTVVESIDSQSTDGFTLIGVAEPSLASAALSGSASTGGSWTIGQVGLYGGIQGGGVSTTSTTRKDHVTAWGRVWPSGTNTANIERLAPAPGNGSLSGTTVFTVYAVEWGTNWTIQRATVDGTNWGGGVNATGEYNTASISSVVRDETFVIASGTTTTNRLRNGWEGNVVTLGDGVNQNANETTVAIGAEGPGRRRAEVYVHEHTNLAVDYRFGSDGSIASGAVTGTQAVDSALVADTYTGGAVSRTEGWAVPHIQPILRTATRRPIPDR